MQLRLIATIVIATASLARADTGSVKGTVIFEGEPPERAAIKRDADPYCAKVAKLSEDVVVDHGKLRDVLVRIKNGSMGDHAAPAVPVVLDQKECMYTPRVVGVMAGQRIAVRNSDGTFHNVNGMVDGKNLWNKAQAAGDHDLLLDGSTVGKVIEVQCNAHPWMKAFVPVQDHPFFAVTDGNGAFEIKGLPPGTYTLEAWHPVLGTKTLQVVIGKAGRANVSARFSYKRSEM